ncbi:MAG TPA: ATP-binding protein [Candidatus Limnocylindria bacterium]|nr:ATP-binding protein [Candidatus Limnocylindria bacterium]
MDLLRELFETNRVIVLSVYGQVFFVLGLAIALQSLKRSALALARPLPWLAAFGIVHGFTEWGYLFIPIQSGYLPMAVTEALLVLQLLMKAASFALLLQFGVELVAAVTQVPILPRLRLLPAAAFLAWSGATLAVSAAYGGFTPDRSAWLVEGRIGEAVASIGAPLAVGDVLARWMLALPGAALAAWGLLASAGAVRSLARPPVVLGLRTAAVAFAVYAVLGGVIGMAAPLPPASALNGAAVLDAVGVPIEVLRSVAGLVIAVAIILALDLFEQETDRALAEARRQELLSRERERIGRDLHDGIIQSIYAAGLHLDEASAALEPDAEVPRSRIRTVLDELERIGDEIRTTIFDLRSASLDTVDAEEIVRAVADELRANTLVGLDLQVRGAWRPVLTADQAEQLRHVVHEAFSNILRHARAGQVMARLTFERERLQLEIADDGVGFDLADAAAREGSGRAQGLRNMRKRAELLGSQLDLQSAPGQGTRLSLTMPVATSRRPT